jgi:nicotinamide-nucleotide amidase
LRRKYVLNSGQLKICRLSFIFGKLLSVYSATPLFMSDISLVTIGSELLRGRIVNTNATTIGQLLRKAGFALSRNVSIPDTEAAIRRTLQQEMKHARVVLVSGGLGPTKDDITKQCLANLFDSPLQLHEPTLRYLEERYQQRNRSFSERNRAQALVPASCEVLPNPKGTAPGMLFRKDGCLLISMPGVPFELFFMLEQEVIPRLREHLAADVFQQKVIRIRRVPESEAAVRVEAFEASLSPQIEISYLPRRDGLWLEFGIRGKEEEQGEMVQALEQAEALTRLHFGDQVYAVGTEPLPALLGQDLKRRGLRIAVAESLTGGLVAAEMVSVSGSSDYFQGSVTAYATEIKSSVLGIDPSLIKEAGVVSEPVAIAMAERVRKLLGADIGLATTGLAEREADPKRPAQAWLGYADGKQSKARWEELFLDRNENRIRAANLAMIFALQEVNEST